MIDGLLLALLFAIVPLAVIAGIAAAIIAARRNDEDDPTEPGGTVRRLFVYGLALVGLVFATIGVSLLIRGALEVAFEQLVIAQHSRSLSMALAFTLVGTPAWITFALIAQHSVANHPVEARSQARRLYFVLARGIALAFVVANDVQAGKMLLGVNAFSAGPVGSLLAWAGVWLVHGRLIASEPAPTMVTRLLERLGRYFGAVIGLFLLLAGAVGMLSAALSGLYDSAFGASLVAGGWTRDLRTGAVLAAVGAAAWGWHWLRDLARRDRLTTLWYVQLFVFGTLTGVALTIVPVAVLLYTILEWFLGTPDSTNALSEFAQAPSLLAALIVGIGTWGYHRALLADACEAGSAQSEPERIYRYAVAAAGLLTTAIGAATVLALAADGLAGGRNDLVRAVGWWRNPLIRGVTHIVVGAPIWAYYWMSLQQAVARNGPADRVALSRRVFLFAAVGIALTAFIVALIVVLYEFFQATLDGDLGRATLRAARWGIAVTITGGIVAYYYFLVLRDDQEATQATSATAQPAMRRDIVLITANETAGIEHVLREIEGTRVRTWHLDFAAGTALSDAQMAALGDAVRALSAEHLVVLIRDGGFEVFPYREERS